MRLFKSNIGLALAGLALALIFMAPSAARSDEWNLLTRISVNHSFSVPGKVLEPNTQYVLKLLDLSGTRNVIQIFNEDQSELLTSFIAASKYRLEPQDTTTFEFIEVNPGYPKPIRSWFYPGRLNGFEFIYPKDQAMDIVANSRQSVLTSNGRVHINDLNTFEIAAVDPDDVIATQTTQTAQTTTTDTDVDMETDTDMDVTREKPTPPEPVTEPESTDLDQDIDADVDTFESETDPAAAQDDADMDAEEGVTEEESEESLPDTAGELPLIGLIGSLAVAIGLGLRAALVRS